MNYKVMSCYNYEMKMKMNVQKVKFFMWRAITRIQPKTKLKTQNTKKIQQLIS